MSLTFQSRLPAANPISALISRECHYPPTQISSPFAKVATALRSIAWCCERRYRPPAFFLAQRSSPLARFRRPQPVVLHKTSHLSVSDCLKGEAICAETSLRRRSQQRPQILSPTAQILSPIRRRLSHGRFHAIKTRTNFLTVAHRTSHLLHKSSHLQHRLAHL